jgi:hypothetical protein
MPEGYTGVRMKRDLVLTFIVCLVLNITISSCGDENDNEVSVVELEGSYDFQADNIDFYSDYLVFTNTPEMIDPTIIYVIKDEADLSGFNTLLSNLDSNSNALVLPSLDTYDYFIFEASNACTSRYELISTQQGNGSITFILNLNEADVTCTENFNLKLLIYRGLQVQSSED